MIQEKVDKQDVNMTSKFEKMDLNEDLSRQQSPSVIQKEKSSEQQQLIISDKMHPNSNVRVNEVHDNMSGTKIVSSSGGSTLDRTGDRVEESK